jgi:hypothetical protein
MVETPIITPYNVQAFAGELMNVAGALLRRKQVSSSAREVAHEMIDAADELLRLRAEALKSRLPS